MNGLSAMFQSFTLRLLPAACHAMFCVVHTCVHHVMLLAGSRHRVAAVSGEKPPQEPDGRTVFMGGWNQSSHKSIQFCMFRLQTETAHCRCRQR